MKCSNCGAPVDQESRFCSYCGESVERAAETAKDHQEIHIHYHQETKYASKETFSSKSRVTALVLCLLLGVLGAHKFYLGKFWVGVVYIFTYGLFGIGWLIDLVTLIAGNPTDKKGYRLMWSKCE